MWSHSYTNHHSHDISVDPFQGAVIVGHSPPASLKPNNPNPTADEYVEYMLYELLSVDSTIKPQFQIEVSYTTYFYNSGLLMAIFNVYRKKLIKG
jgi:hypothetical protein